MCLPSAPCVRFGLEGFLGFDARPLVAALFAATTILVPLSWFRMSCHWSAGWHVGHSWGHTELSFGHFRVWVCPPTFQNSPAGVPIVPA